MRVEKSEKIKWLGEYTFYQTGANLTLLVIAVWAIISVWFHTQRPVGMIQFELTFMGTLSIIFWILVPLYWKRVRWSYVAGIGLIFGGLGGGIGVAMGLAIAPHRTLQFSISLYDMITLIIYVTGILGVYFSFRAFLELKKKVKKKDLAGIGGIVILTS